MDRLRVALIGPGFIAQRHLEVLSRSPARSSSGSRRAACRRPRGGGPVRRSPVRRPRADAGHGATGCRLGLRDARRARGAGARPSSSGASTCSSRSRSPRTSRRRCGSRGGRAAGVIAGVAYHWRAMDTLTEVEDVIAARPGRPPERPLARQPAGPRLVARRATSGGQVVEQATHLVDLSRRLLGEATVVAATADRHPHPDHPGR